MSQRIGVLALVFLCCATFSRAQTPTAVVNGQVRDTSGAAIPNATVVVINNATNIRYTVETDDEGIYSVPNLPPGTYRIQVSKQGFKTIVHPDIVLHVQDAQAIGFTLPVGPTSDTVTVEGGAPLINTESAAVSTLVDRQFAENLPMNGRSFQTLINLTPGVVVSATNRFDSGQFNVNGQRATSNYWTVDGVGANIGVSAAVPPGNGFGGALGSFSALGGTNSLVSVDALQEFRIQTSTYAPEFGRTPGAQISILTRSGTNQFHGTLFDYLRNDVLDANDWFANSAELPKPQERQNDFGGTLSGPIVRDRTFFFFSYEGLRLRLPQSALSTVPCDSTCQVFGNARDMAVSAMQPFLNAFPLPNGPEVFTPCTPNVGGCPASGQRPTGAAQFNASSSDPATLDAYSLRVDHRLSNKLTLLGRYNHSPSEVDQRRLPSALNVVTPVRITIQTVTGGVTWVISPGTTNELRFNYSRTDSSSRSLQDNFGGAVPLSSLPLPSPFTGQDSSFGLQIRSLRGQNATVGNILQNVQRQFNVVDGLFLQKGPHSLKFGVDFRRLSPRFNPRLYAQFASFSNVPRAVTGSLSFSGVTSNAAATFLFHNLGLYAQDTWRVSPRLTLTYGVRWDLDVVPSSENGPNFPALTGYDLNDLSNLALAPPGTPPFDTTYGNFAPRVGVAYQPKQSQSWPTVLRGGFGVFYDLASSEDGAHLTNSTYPFSASTFNAGGTFPLSSAMAAPPPITPDNLSSPFGQLGAFDPRLRLPYTLQWNVALEQGLGRQQAVSASYIGAVGRRLLQDTAVISPSPNISTAQLIGNTATSDYHALQIQFQRRLSRGIQALASYTWSHSIDTASAGSAANPANTNIPGSNRSVNRGASDFDIRHAFSAGLTYDIPAPKINPFMNAVLLGWSIQNFIFARSAPPVTVFDSLFFEFQNSFAQVRADVVPGQPFYIHGPQYPGGKALNPAAFADPPTAPAGCIPGVDFPCDPTRQGNLGRNALRGFGAVQWDFAIHRDFPIHESFKLQFRAEMFNVLNHPNFAPPDGDVADITFGTFGVSTQMLGRSLSAGAAGTGSLNPLYQIGGSRSMQFALKLMF